MGADASQAFARFWNGFIGLWAGGPAQYAAAVPVPASVRGRASATVSASACGPGGARPYLVRHRGTPFQMEQIIPFRLHIDRAKWDFLLHLEYRGGERVRSPERVTKKVPTKVETLDVTSGGDEGNRTPDLLTASQALSQLSYAPKQQKRTIRECI